MTNESYHPVVERLLLSASELDPGSFGFDYSTFRSARQRFAGLLDENLRPFLDLLLVIGELKKQPPIEPLGRQLQELLNLCGSRLPAPSATTPQLPAATLIANSLTPRGAMRAISLRGGRGQRTVGS